MKAYVANGAPSISFDSAQDRLQIKKKRNYLDNVTFANPDFRSLENSMEVHEKSAEKKSPGEIVVSVSDTGVGIPEGDREKIFEPLFTTRAKGIGLGLAIVQTLVEGHGGAIEVESKVGERSTFTVRLPVRRE